MKCSGLETSVHLVNDDCFSLELDSEGNILLQGTFVEMEQLEKIPTLPKGSNGTQMASCSRLILRGQVLWSIAGGKGSTELIHDIRLDADDNIFVVGEQDHTYDSAG